MASQKKPNKTTQVSVVKSKVNLAKAFTKEITERHNQLYRSALDDFSKGDYKKAAEKFFTLINKHSKNEKLHNNYAATLSQLNQDTKAIEHLNRSIEIKPNVIAYLNLAKLKKQSGQCHSAIKNIQQALALEPQNAEIHFEYALLLLLIGEYQHGWREYEWRWQKPKFIERHLHLPKTKRWQGQSLQQKTLLVTAEQGFGDQVQFSRYLFDLKVRFSKAELIFAVTEALLDLFKQSNLTHIAKIIALPKEKSQLPSFNYHIPLISIPHRLGTTVENISRNYPSLTITQETQQKWSKLFQESKHKQFKVGLVYSGSKLHPNDSKRTIKPDLLKPLLSIANVTWYHLQIDEALQEQTLPLVDLTSHIKSFEDTTAALSQLDLLISVDTAIVHIAGCLQKETWLLLPFIPDWRWQLATTDTAWYESMRLFRQPQPEDWQSLISAVSEQLRLRIKPVKRPS